MNTIKKTICVFSLFLLLFGEITFNETFAAFDVQGARLFKDNNICIIRTAGGIPESFSLANIQTNSESIQSKVSSSGSLCPPPPFFTGGAILTTASGITTQAQPNVQSLGRGVIISEMAGDNGGISSSGEPSGFNQLVSRFGGISNILFEISLPSGCDVIDDDDDIVGASTDLSTINDFSFPTCTSTNGLTVQCNTASGLLTASNGLVPANSGSPAKARFVISDINTVADSNMIDSILIRFDSQDIFCSDTATGQLIATVVAQNAASNSTMSETIGTADLGTFTQAARISYAKEKATSLKGEVSENEVGTTPLLIGGNNTISNKLQIEELHNESIPIGGQSSASLINPPNSLTAENNVINLWLIPSYTNLFENPPSSSDITFSDDSFIVYSAPYIVKTNADDLNAPIGTLVIPLRKNQNGVDPQTVKTTISLTNLRLTAPNSDTKDSTVTLALYEGVSGAIVNTPVPLSINNTTNQSNPQNFSAFATQSTRALAQNIIVGGAVNEATGAAQIQTNNDLTTLVQRSKILGAPQIIGFTKVISSLTPIDVSAITTQESNSIITITGNEGSSIGSAKVKIESFAKSSMSAFDSVTITSRKDGSFTAKLQADFSGGDITLSFTQTASGIDSSVVTRLVSKGLSCDKTVCGCGNPSCTPTLDLVNDYIKKNGGLASIISKGGDILQEIIKSAKKALGL